MRPWYGATASTNARRKSRSSLYTEHTRPPPPRCTRPAARRAAADGESPGTAHSVATGPNTSSRWTTVAAAGSFESSSVGATKYPFDSTAVSPPTNVRDEEVPGCAAGRDVRTEDGGVQAVGFDVQARPAPRELLAQLRRRLRGTGERDHVLGPEPVEQIAGAAGDEGERAWRQRRGLDAQLGEPERDQRGAGRRLGNDGHPGEQRRRGLLRRAPGGEVERVDVDRHAVAQRAQRPQLRAQVGIVGERGDGAVDVELRISPRVAAVGDGQADHLVAVGVQRPGPGPQHVAPLREGHLPQRGRARARVLQRRREVDPARPGACERLLGGWIDQRGESALSLDPPSLDVAAQDCRHGRPPAGRPAGALGRGSAWGISASAYATQATAAAVWARSPGRTLSSVSAALWW